MIKNELSLQKYFSNLFHTASLPLNRSQNDIQELFPDKAIHISDGIETGEFTKMLEVKVEKALLNYLFTHSELCHTCIIYLENDPVLKQYIQYCARVYPYKRLTELWNLTVPDMLIGEHNNSYYFILRNPQRTFYN